ncbi:ATP-grasp domain-containing protein [Nocardioides sp. InS609-2]|uniref:ATP-grasp domain-containing protein n=1 Tax=Nocardioides sp. InS609-2 TaxID=2760705 RepID=UPI0020BD4735|nr:ATP-grasp domain-containing protein [Nocardioides sp. InS609-2]
MKVIITGAGALLGQGMLRSLADSQLDVTLVAADPSPLAAGLYWTPHRYLIPMADDPGYIGAIDKLLASEKPDALLVGTDVELPLFARHRHELEARHGTHIVIASSDVVAIADDKFLTYEFMRDHGFSPPVSRLPFEAGDLVSEFGFPLVVKPRVGARSVGLSLVWSEEELKHAISARDGLMVQEHVATDREEYTAGTITFGGPCLASIVMRRDLRDGNTSRAYVEDFPELDMQVREMATVLGAWGPANFQFRADDGKARVFEINGRFSGTTPLRRLAGFNEVEMVLRHLVLGEAITQPMIRPMSIFRHLVETVVLPEEVMR